MKWWEKTVEYMFVKNYINIDSFIAPLDGDEEKAGDAIFCDTEHYILIEFKKDFKSISNEYKKFVDFNKAKKLLVNEDDHHIIIYGEIINNDLDLKAQTYFSKKSLSKFDKIFKNGIESEKFRLYLDNFLSFKKTKKSKITSESYGLIAGVTNDGNISKFVTIDEYSISKENEMSKTKTKSRDYSRSM